MNQSLVITNNKAIFLPEAHSIAILSNSNMKLKQYGNTRRMYTTHKNVKTNVKK